MAIQHRRGAKADFNAQKMLAGEIAVTTDGTRKAYVAFAPGDVKELASKEDVQADMSVNDENDPAYVKNRTHWIDGEVIHKLPEVFLPESVVTQIEKSKNDISKLSGEIVKLEEYGFKHVNLVDDCEIIVGKQYSDKGITKFNNYDDINSLSPIEATNVYLKNKEGSISLNVYNKNGSFSRYIYIPKNTLEFLELKGEETFICIFYYATGDLKGLFVSKYDLSEVDLSLKLVDNQYKDHLLQMEIKKIEANSPLNDKTIVFDGDSITEGAGVTDIQSGLAPNNNKGWGYWIQQNHPISICYGYAKSGWKVARRTDSNDSLLSHIEQYPADVDCFVLSGGYNDQATQVAIGEIVEPTDGNNAYFNATFDEYTFIGALESWFKQLRKNYPNAKIVYVLTPKRIYATNPVFNNDSKGDKVKDVIYSTGYERINLFWDSIKKVCKKWSVKYLDLSENCGIVGTGELTGDGLDVNKRYYKLDTDGNPDFTHPNTLFYKTFIVPQIEDLLKSVLD